MKIFLFLFLYYPPITARFLPFRYFKDFGIVKESFIKMDALTGRSRGFGFVIFVDASSTDVVLSTGPHQLKGKTLDIKAAVPKHLTKDRGLGSRKVFVGGLSQMVTEDYLTYFFERFGEIMETKIMFDHSTPKPHRHRGFAFVTFVDPDAADEVCRINYHQIMDKTVEVKLASVAEEPTRGKIAPSLYWKRGNHGGSDADEAPIPTIIASEISANPTMTLPSIISSGSTSSSSSLAYSMPYSAISSSSSSASISSGLSSLSSSSLAPLMQKEVKKIPPPLKLEEQKATSVATAVSQEESHLTSQFASTQGNLIIYRQK